MVKTLKTVFSFLIFTRPVPFGDMAESLSHLDFCVSVCLFVCLSLPDGAGSNSAKSSWIELKFGVQPQLA